MHLHEGLFGCCNRELLIGNSTVAVLYLYEYIVGGSGGQLNRNSRVDFVALSGSPVAVGRFLVVNCIGIGTGTALGRTGDGNRLACLYLCGRDRRSILESILYCECRGLADNGALASLTFMRT